MKKDLPAWLAHISEQHWQTIDMGLSRMQQMVERMGLQKPHGANGKVVTIAGTNGKGSTAVALERILTDSGLVAGTTLSPHVHKFNERIRVQGREQPDRVICDAFAAVEASRQDLTLTYFEFAALAALYIFQRAAVDVCILEIGLGGRLDAFNAVDADVAVITSISFDHQEFLGDTLDQIGGEKAGILRRGQVLITGPDMPAGVLAAAESLALTPRVYGRDFHDPELPSAGSLAAQNAALAAAAAAAVTGGRVPLNLQGLARVELPGRMQICQKYQRTWVLDVAHNPAGVDFLLDQLQQRGLQPRVLICGMLKNKDHAAVAARLQQLGEVPLLLIDTRGERGMSAADLQAAMAVPARAVADAGLAVEAAGSATARGDVILVFGSFNAVEQFAWLAV